MQILYLENDAVVVNTANVLAFSTSLEEKLEVVKNVGGIHGKRFFQHQAIRNRICSYSNSRLSIFF